MSSTVVGLMYKGQKLPGPGGLCVQDSGGWHTACGATTNIWAEVRYKGYTRYVARVCMSKVYA